MGSRILEDMDVESLTDALQGREKPLPSDSSRDASISSRRSPSTTDHDPANTPTLPSMSNQSHVGSAASASGDEQASGRLGESTLSWVDQFTTPSSSNGRGSPTSSAEVHMSDSIVSGSVSNVSEAEAVSLVLRMSDCHLITRSVQPSSEASSSRSVRDRSKAELWKEVKLLSQPLSSLIITSC